MQDALTDEIVATAAGLAPLIRSASEEGEPLERDVLRGLLDPPLELIGVLELGLLRGDQARARRSCPPARTGAARTSRLAASRTRRRSGRTRRSLKSCSAIAS